VINPDDHLVVNSKLETESLTLTNTSNQVSLNTGGAGDIILSTDIVSANRTYTFHEVSVDASFVMTEANQTINGKKTFTNGIISPLIECDNRL
jgi:hypothetical protein